MDRALRNVMGEQYANQPLPEALEALDRNAAAARRRAADERARLEAEIEAEDAMAAAAQLQGGNTLIPPPSPLEEPEGEFSDGPPLNVRSDDEFDYLQSEDQEMADVEGVMGTPMLPDSPAAVANNVAPQAAADMVPPPGDGPVAAQTLGAEITNGLANALKETLAQLANTLAQAVHAKGVRPDRVTSLLEKDIHRPPMFTGEKTEKDSKEVSFFEWETAMECYLQLRGVPEEKRAPFYVNYIGGKAKRYLADYMAKKNLSAATVTVDAIRGALKKGPFALSETYESKVNQLMSLRLRSPGQYADHLATFNRVAGEYKGVDPQHADIPQGVLVCWWRLSLPVAVRGRIFCHPVTMDQWEKLEDVQLRTTELYRAEPHLFADQQDAGKPSGSGTGGGKKAAGKQQVGGKTPKPSGSADKPTYKLLRDHKGPITSDAFGYRKRHNQCVFCEEKACAAETGNRYWRCPKFLKAKEANKHELVKKLPGKSLAIDAHLRSNPYAILATIPPEEESPSVVTGVSPVQDTDTMSTPVTKRPRLSTDCRQGQVSQPQRDSTQRRPPPSQAPITATQVYTGTLGQTTDNKNDRCILKSEFERVQSVAGVTCQLDCCANTDGSNALLPEYCSQDKSFLDLTADQVRDKMLWMNPPYDMLDQFVDHWFKLRAQSPNTGCILLLPEWAEKEWWQKVNGLEQICVYPKGSHLFHQPTRGGGRRRCGPLPWKVIAFIDRPEQAPKPKLLALGDSDLLFQLPCKVAGAKSTSAGTAMLDSGASAAAVLSTRFADAHGIRVTPNQSLTECSITLANGSTADVRGEAKINLEIGGMRSKVQAVIADLAPPFDIILGQEWLKEHQARLDYGSEAVQFKKGGKRYTVQVNKRTPPPRSKTKPYLSSAQVMRSVRKGHVLMLAEVKHIDDPTPGQPAQSEEDIQMEAAASRIKAEFSDVFVDELPPGLPPDREVPETIPLEAGARPQFRHAFRASPREKEEMQKQITEGIESGRIQPSRSPWGSPVLFVKKPDGSLRMCVDYRAVNKLTVRNRFPIPRIDDLLDSLNGARFFSTLDLKAGYHQIRLAPEDVPRTAFNTPFGHYEYRVLPFGLTNAPATFQTVMNDILRPYLNKFVLVYLDDIMVFSKTAEEHEQHLRLVLQALRNNQLYANAKKCKLNVREVEFLGHVVSRDGLKVDPKKTQAVNDWPRPTDLTQLRGFLGLSNYFRRFIKDYSKVVRPLTMLTRKDTPTPLPWPPAAAEAFQKVKEALVSPPVLKMPDFGKPFDVITDASEFCIGAILVQEGRPVAYESRLCSSAECNYPTHDRELLAIVHAYTVWRCYLEGVESTVYTDHDPLKRIFDQPTLNARQARWLEMLSGFRPVIKYRPGEGNPADSLSRLQSRDLVTPLHGARITANMPWAVNSFSVSRGSGRSLYAAVPHQPPSAVEVVRGRLTCGSLTLAKPLFPEAIKAMYSADAWFQNPANTASLKQDNGLWYLDGKLAIPQAFVKIVLAECHDTPYAGHLGITKTKALVESRFWWPSWKKDVAEYVKTCPSCQMNKASHCKPSGLLQPLPVPDRPWQSVSMDFIVSLPATQKNHDAILVFVDRLSKMVHLAPCTTKCSAEDSAHLFMQYVYRAHGMPTTLVSDRDARWTSQFWRELCSSLGIEQAMSSAFHPQSDGQTERANRVVEDMLRHFISPTQDNWDLLLPCIEFAMNSARHESIQTTPFKLIYGYNPSSPFDVALGLRPAGRYQRTQEVQEFIKHMDESVQHAKRCMQAAQQRQKQYADGKRKAVSYQVGDKVLLSTKNLNLAGAGTRKLMPKYVGPFAVKELINAVAVRLDLPPTMQVHDVFHVSLLRPYRSDGRSMAAPPPVIIAGRQEYEVEQVLQHRTNKRKRCTEYLVKWVGLGPEHNEWVLEPDMTADGAFVNSKVSEYWDQQQSGSRGRTTTTPKPAVAATTDKVPSGHKVVRKRKTRS